MTRTTGQIAWTPLLSGESAEQCLETVEQIRRELRGTVSSGGVPAGARFSLLQGDAGLALFFAYLYRAFAREEDGDLALDLLGRAIDGIGETVVPAGLYPGFSGVAWVVEHLRGWLIDPAAGDPGKDLAEALAEELRGAAWEESFDLYHGLVGLGVYSLERLPRPGARECLEAVLARLASSAERSPEGAAWWTAPEQLPAPTREEFPAGYYNLGVAHGQPGVIGFLSQALAAGAGRETRSLLQEATAWLLGTKLPAGERSVFPRCIDPLSPPQPARLSWCYGDLGIAVVLLAAARQTCREDWETEAMALARKAAARTAELADMKDACLCHGTAGAAHLFGRLFQATGDPSCGTAARFWMERTLQKQRPGEAIAGFPSWSIDERGEPGFRADPGFLNGTAGVGLALLAAATSVEPAWDRVMLTSVPEAGQAKGETA